MKLIIRAEDGPLLAQLVARVARFGLQPVRTTARLTLRIEEDDDLFNDAICLVGARTVIGAATAYHFATQEPAEKRGFRCILCLPELEQIDLAPLALYHHCRIVHWQDSDAHWQDTIQLSLFTWYDALPEALYRQISPNLLTDCRPMRTARWDGSEPIRFVMQHHVPGFKAMFEGVFAEDDRFDLVAFVPDAEASYQAVLDHNPHLLICDPMCRITRAREIPFLGYQPHHDLPWLLRARPDLRVLVSYETPRLSLLRLVHSGHIQGFLAKSEEDFSMLKAYIVTTAKGETRLSADAQAVMKAYLDDSHS